MEAKTPKRRTRRVSVLHFLHFFTLHMSWQCHGIVMAVTSRPEAKHSMAPPEAAPDTNAAAPEPAAEAATAASATASAAEVAMDDAVPRMTTNNS